MNTPLFELAKAYCEKRKVRISVTLSDSESYVVYDGDNVNFYLSKEEFDAFVASIAPVFLK